MTVMDKARTIRLGFRVDPEENFHGLAPVRAIFRGVQQTHVKLDMRHVIVGKTIAGGRGVLEKIGHELPPQSAPAGAQSKHPSKLLTILDASQQSSADAMTILLQKEDLTFRVSAIIDEQHSLSTVGRQENDTASFKCPSDLIASRFVHP